MNAQPAGGGGLGQLARDRRVQVGVAIAAGVGLVVMLTRGRAANTTSPAQPATLDTSAMDTYNAVQGDLQNFASQLKALQDQLNPHPTNSQPSNIYTTQPVGPFRPVQQYLPRVGTVASDVIRTAPTVFQRTA